MKRFTRSIFLVCFAAVTVPRLCVARDVVEVEWTPTVQEYCHVLRFPSGWQMPTVVREKNGSLYSPSKFSLSDSYEFRVAGVLDTKFLVRGSERVINKYYTTNIYEADLSDPRAVAQPVSEEAWNSAAAVPLINNAFAKDLIFPSRYPKYVEFHGLQFVKSGDSPDIGVRVSPDRSFLIVQSWSGKLAPGGSTLPGDFSIGLDFSRDQGKLFFDVYNAETGKKQITMIASFLNILPEEAFGKTGWITERYFLIPLDQRRERCLICDFGRRR